MSIVLELNNLKSNFFDESKKEGNECLNTSIGNILFQISYGLILGWDNDVQFYCPDIEEWCKKNNLKKEDTIWRNVDTKKVKYIHNLKEIERKRLMNINDFEENEKKKLFDEGILLYGFFYKYKYPIKLRNFFRPNAKDLQYIFSKYGKYLNTNCCSIHFRRGKDYIKLAEKYNKGFLLNERYYIKAIGHLKNKVRYFLVFSDNMEYSRNFLERHYRNKNKLKFIYIRERDFIDLWIISRCKHNIISNSTFSIWGAFFNHNPDRIVIAPQKTWQFENDRKNKRNLNKIYLPSWIVMDDK